MQRVGRINRVGTKFNDIYVFNFFPSSQVSENMTLEENISSKIQAFHDTLGEDFKYLSENEDVDTYGIFGKTLYDKLNSDKVLEEEDFEEDTSLKYLNIIRDIRDNNEELFTKVKKYPRKIRSARYLDEDGTITFFRKGKVKRFFITDEEKTREIKFLEAIRYFECDEKEKKANISKLYYKNLKANKEGLIYSLQQDKIDISPTRKVGKNYNKQLLIHLKDISRYSKFTEFEDQRIDKLMSLFEDGVIPKNILKEIMKKIKEVNNPIEKLNTIWDMVPNSYIENNNSNDNIEEYNTEVVLSLDLV